MFTVIGHNTAKAPIVICDHCQKRIETAKGGVVIYPQSAKEGHPVVYFHAHRGACDKAITAKHGDLGGTDDLAAHMAWLLGNLKLEGDALDEAIRNAAIMDAL